MAVSSVIHETTISTATVTSVMVIGSWDAFQAKLSDPECHLLDLHFCEDHGSAPVVALRQRVQWIICGFGLGDQEMSRAVSSVHAVHPSVRLAVLGDPEDWRRCEAWLRRGCQVYLGSNTALSRMAAAIIHAQSFDLTISGTEFQRLQALRRTAGIPELTPREFEVLERLRQGLMNREIADILYVTENTVEYHMKNLLQKLQARNRLEVVERASALGI